MEKISLHAIQVYHSHFFSFSGNNGGLGENLLLISLFDSYIVTMIISGAYFCHVKTKG